MGKINRAAYVASNPFGSAAGAVRLMRRSEDEAALRDAVLLTVAGDDPGPAGKVFWPPKDFPPENPLSRRKRWPSRA